MQIQLLTGFSSTGSSKILPNVQTALKDLGNEGLLSTRCQWLVPVHALRCDGRGVEAFAFGILLRTPDFDVAAMQEILLRKFYCRIKLCCGPTKSSAHLYHTLAGNLLLPRNAIVLGKFVCLLTL